MNKKNEFFADYFKNQLEQLIIEIDDFVNNHADYKGEVIDGLLSGLEDEWSNCVLLDVKEGYPVIDMWNEYVEENQ